MSHAYTEDQLVEQPAIGLFAALGWQTISALEETFGTAGTLGSETKSEVVLVERLRIALTKTRGLSLGFVRSRRDRRGGRTIYPTAVTRTGGGTALTVIRRWRCAYHRLMAVIPSGSKRGEEFNRDICGRIAHRLCQEIRCILPEMF
jgi:hypothetical protein